ncbi:MgtC/SapB family protein [Jeotgalibacillus proteolyticus]|uniref:MgtC/SapB transporter n=1 Tax=Jeotgalibacillus proteolyticus TaxID=2082395 RepID=A0A2S5GAF7_9BACL|nr:MgtC/SapB family protein [Jeotgalibacillus proteolyticus]PPA69969.1 MgtC/SapB transporter [Jeotgalibacillus proteolyticus]
MFLIDEIVFIKLGLTALLGLVIGIERELKRKPVGLKTSLVISIVSCLLTIVSIESAYSFPGDDSVNITMDPLRLAAQIVSGIGFLGAGVILHRGNDTISGLTTAAIIWGAAGIGIAVGAGFFVEAILGVILLIISVEILPVLLMWIGPMRLREKDMYLKITVQDANYVGTVVKKLEQDGIKVDKMRLRDMKSKEHMIELHTSVHLRRLETDIYLFISKLPGVTGVEIESR